MILRFLVNRDVTLSPRDTVEVFLDGRRVLLFDPETGMNIFAV
jgi:hypothetical protein